MNDGYKTYTYQTTATNGNTTTYSTEIRGGLSTVRDNTGNPTYWGDLDGIYTRAYTYDLNSRLATETYPGQPQVTNTYDWVGNKTSLPGSEYNAADQLTSTTGHTYTYDGRGNMVSDNSTQYTYTPSNLLATAGGSSMTWDAAGNRISFTSSTDVNNPYTFVYDPTAGIPAIIEESHAGISTYYIREPGGALIARVSGADVKYYGFDDLGSTLFLSDSTGIVTDKYTYDAWGNSTSHEGSTQQPYQYVGRLGYYTHWQDVSFIYIQLGVRFYSHVSSRFERLDPIRYDYNWYAYVSDRPLKKTDPTGLEEWECNNPQPPRPARRCPLVRDIVGWYWCRGCSSSCVRNCNTIYESDNTDIRWEQCTEACARAEALCESRRNYVFNTRW